MNILEQVIAYEIGQLNHDEIVELFQELVRTGTIEHFQGSYKRTAAELLQAGLITL